MVNQVLHSLSRKKLEFLFLVQFVFTLDFLTCVDSWTNIPADSMPSDPSDSGSGGQALTFNGHGRVELLSAWNWKCNWGITSISDGNSAKNGLISYFEIIPFFNKSITKCCVTFTNV